MSKEEVITAIRKRNQGAPESFLAAFPTRHLADYLARLTTLQAPHAHLARTSAAPAIACRAH